MSALFEELDYRETPLGAISLRRRRVLSLDRDVFEVMLGDEHLMSSLFTEGEIALAELGLAATRGPALDVVVGGLGLGFANVVSPGPVGIVAASGTGCQQLLALLDHAGVGVTSALGVGGRDLSSEVRGASTREALRRLDADPAVELIVVISKPPAADVPAEIEAYAASLSTPVELALLGAGRPDLTAAAESVLARLGRDVPSWPVSGSAVPGSI